MYNERSWSRNVKSSWFGSNTSYHTAGWRIWQRDVNSVDHTFPSAERKSDQSDHVTCVDYQFVLLAILMGPLLDHLAESSFLLQRAPRWERQRPIEPALRIRVAIFFGVPNCKNSRTEYWTRKLDHTKFDDNLKSDPCWTHGDYEIWHCSLSLLTVQMQEFNELK